MGDKPWTYDQFQRYSVLRAVQEIFFSDTKPPILDVGGAAPDGAGKGFWLPAAEISSGKVVVVDPLFCPVPGFVQGSGLELPFKDGSFVIVAALDVLEHIPENGRSRFISELSRISSDMVLLCCPFADEAIKRAEDELFSLIKTLHDLPHKQLCEHKEYGLPDKNTITDLLQEDLNCGIDFPYGSLDTWLFIQSIKYSFLQIHNAIEIQRKLDEFAALRMGTLDFSAPFYRHYWLYSKTKTQPEMDAALPRLKEKIIREYSGTYSFERQAALNRELIRAFNPECISAVVVTSADRRNLDICLDHLLTQQTEFDLEVTVWNIYNDPDIKKYLKAFFPGVKCLTIGNKRTTAGTLRTISLNLRGNYILFLSDDILLPPLTAGAFYNYAKARDEFIFLTPRILDEEGEDQVRFWAGRPKSIHAPGDDSDNGEWFWTECRFFARDALMNLEDKRSFSRENLFLSRRDPDLPAPLYCREFAVSRKGQLG